MGTGTPGARCRPAGAWDARSIWTGSVARRPGRRRLDGPELARWQADGTFAGTLDDPARVTVDDAGVPRFA
ncbi:MAG: hypothetical protein RID91_03675 [Azospirillaceae bacterium]